MWILDRAFAKDEFTAWHMKTVNEIQMGYDCSERLPMPARKRRWPYKLDRQVVESGSNLEKHYLDYHAILSKITTHKPVTCKHCGMHVWTKDKRREHGEGTQSLEE